MNDEKFAENYQLYKPNAKGTGGSLSLSFSKKGLFIKIAKQLGTQRLFDWKNATTLFLDLADISQILNVFKTKKEASIFHDSAKSTATTSNASKGLKITWNDQYQNYFWQITRKEGEQSINAAVSVSPEESLIIRVLLEYTIPLLLRWQLVDTASEPIAVQDGSGSSTTPPIGTAEPLKTTGEPVPSNIASVFPGAEVVQAPTPEPEPTPAPEGVQLTLDGKTRDQKLKEIMQLAKTKLGATTAAEAKAKVIEATNLAFIDPHLDEILAKLQAK